MKVLAQNKRARYDYEITEKLIAGVSLLGAEVKSIKNRQVSLKGSFIAIYSGEAYLTNAYVTPYPGAQTKPDPSRTRKLLLHRRELESLVAKKQSGLSAVPLSLVQEKTLVKVEIGIGRGKKRYDKRQTIKQRDQLREAGREISQKLR